MSMLGLILTVGKLFTWGADEEALDSLRFVPGVCVRLLVLLTAAMSAYHGVARFGNWLFSRRMVPVASANDCQKCVHVCACACVRLCVCVSVWSMRECVCLRVNAKHPIITNKAFSKKISSIVAFSLLQAHTLECFQSQREFYEFVNLMEGWLALILAAVLGPWLRLLLHGFLPLLPIYSVGCSGFGLSCRPPA